MEETSPESLLKKDSWRLLVANATEQRRLEKIQKYLDKEKHEKQCRLTRDQQEAFFRLCEFSGRSLAEVLREQKEQKNKGSTCFPVMDGPLNHSVVDTRKPETEINSKISREDKTIPDKQVTFKDTPSTNKLKLPELNLDHFLFSRKQQFPLRRVRSWSWSSPADFLRKAGNFAHNRKETTACCLHVSKHRPVSMGDAKKKLMQDKPSGDTESEEKRSKSLTELLPPIHLPPIHAQRRPSLQEHKENREKPKETEEKSLKKQYDELAHCRYLRIYKRGQKRK